MKNKLPISLEEFKEYLLHIKEISQKSDKFSSALREFFDDSNFTGVHNGKEQDFLINWLKKVVNDKYDVIDYFIYEIDWGEKGKDCITFHNGEKYSLQTIEQLYYYLTNYD